ncbi:heavy metal translocating P-type ATPase [Aliivibrio sifiae]|uniref:heavy metal translocating P-type ATPase n=1 Tax=Aliivibrio sifiae TaxID=566293 RepID=UPI003D11F66F
MSKDCYHCSEPVPSGSHFQVDILGQTRDMCCPGCESVAQTIVENGLSSYYQYRTAPADKADLVPEQLKALAHYDHSEIQKEFIRTNDNFKEVTLSLDGVSCAACAWLIEKQLANAKGIHQIKVNTSTHRALLSWNPEETKLSTLLTLIHQLGYKAAPFEADKQEEEYHRSMKQYLYRLGVAGLATMQVMMLAVALYLEVFGDLDAEFRNYLRYVSLVFATPVMLYSALPFYMNAWRSLKARTLGMDVPVSIAMLFAYFASVVATVTETGEVFFESVAMFTFFLLLGRFLEMRARRKAAAITGNLLKLIPVMATLTSGKKVPARTLDVGDTVIVPPGEHLPADGIVLSGCSAIDESMFTGESMPVAKTETDPVYAGTINGDGNLTIEVTKTKADSLISNIVKLQDEAQMSKPKVAEIADLVARYFVAGILIISAFTWFYWHETKPDDAFWIMLSVLVATCPCALSLATPTAITCSTSRLAQLGLMLRRGHVLETLCKVNRLVIDKTGTLTEGNIRLTQISTFSSINPQQSKVIAAELESFANHPIARAFSEYREPELTHFERVENIIGSGLVGYSGQDEWKIGHKAFATPNFQLENQQDYQVWLSKNGQPVAAFSLDDPIREESKAFIQSLHHLGIKITMLTGDSSSSVERVAKTLDIDDVISGASPKGKLDYLTSLPKNEISLMVGDGINDAPTLAGAHLSIAMGSGTDVAKASADMILLGDNLSRLIDARELAMKTRKIIRENLAWALGYNAIILPLAVMGLVAPYVAVVGMSGSSIIVVSNSLRLLKENG